MPEPYVLHAALVHFPIALLLTGLAAVSIGEFTGRRHGWLAEATSWLLWLGTASAWIAVALGLFAERTAPHVPPAWETLADHKTLGLWTAGVFSLLAAWRLFFKQRWARTLIVVWIAAAALLLATAYEGGELVFNYNMGTQASVP